MKVDNIHVDKDSIIIPSKQRRALKSYHVFFITALIFVGLLNIISTFQKVLLVKNEVTYATELGYKELMTSIETEENFDRATQHFLDAKKSLNTLVPNLEIASNSTALRAIDSVLEVGVNLTRSAELMIEAKLEINSYLENFEEKKEFSHIESTIKEAKKYIDDSAQILASTDLKSLKTLLGEERYAHIEKLESQVYALSDILKTLQSIIRPLAILSGDRYPHRILVLLQNNNEIRPTGGFIGTLGFVDMNDGVIEKIELKDVYDFDGIGIEREPHPEIKMVAGDTWGIRDSNTSPYFPLSASQAKQFLEEAKGPGVDSVIAIDLEFVRSIMESTGPLYIREFDLPLNAGNFDIILSYFVESKRFGETTPKKILSYFVDYMKEAISENLTVEELIDIVVENAETKHIQAYSDDPEVQAFFEALGVAGQVHYVNEKTDYLNVVNINIGGNKSDRFMHQAVTHKTYVSKNGDLSDQVTVKRTHGFDEEVDRWLLRELRYVGIAYPEEHLMNILGRDDNEVLTRVYVPRGSTLTASIGVDESDVSVIEEEITLSDGTTKILQYFLFKMTTLQGESSEVTLSYDLPYGLDLVSSISPLDNYRLFVDTQAGVNSVDFEKHMYFAPQLESYAFSPAFTDMEDAEVYKALLKKDKVLSVAVGPAR